jgi:xylulokinase
MSANGGVYLGIDVGTTGTKCVAIDARGAVLAEALGEHPVSYPKPGWSEQQPEDWWRSTVESVRAVVARAPSVARDVAAIGLSGQMHGFVPVDARGEVVRPCILWNDSRSAAICDRLQDERPGLAELLRLTGNRVFPGFQAPKILWLREHEPAAYARTAKALLPKDWLRFRMSGAYAAEVSDASGTAVFDCGRRTWSDELLGALELPRALFPDVAESTELTTRLSARAAAELGLPAGTPIAGGGGDQAASAVGSGIVDEGTVSCTIGTSGVVFATSRAWRPSPRGELHAFCHAVPGRWHLMGVMLSAGGSLRWFRDTVVPDLVATAKARGVDPYELIAECAAQAPAGSDGLVFLPFLSGERCPVPDPAIRGGFLGLDVSHGRAQLCRATFEGITAALAENLALIRALGVRADEVRLSGGGARSAFWRQMCADMFEARIALPATDAGGAFGAALIAATGAGAFASIDDACRATVHARAAEAPDSRAREVAARVRARVTSAYARALRVAE